MFLCLKCVCDIVFGAKVHYFFYKLSLISICWFHCTNLSLCRLLLLSLLNSWLLSTWRYLSDNLTFHKELKECMFYCCMHAFPPVLWVIKFLPSIDCDSIHIQTSGYDHIMHSAQIMVINISYSFTVTGVPNCIMPCLCICRFRKKTSAKICTGKLCFFFMNI